jgi:predicted transcriptional regulator of viral defense system
MRRADVLANLAGITREQAGYVTHAQARRMGVPTRDLIRLAESGDLRRVARGVYALMGAFPGPREPTIAAWLRLVDGRMPWETGAPPAVASHATAASIHNIGTIPEHTPTFTVGKRRHRPQDETRPQAETFRIHVATLEPGDWGWVDLPEGLRFPVTTPARTIVDLAWSGEDHDHVIDGFDEAEEASLVTVDQVRDAIKRRQRRRGRGSAAWLDDVLRRR